MSANHSRRAFAASLAGVSTLIAAGRPAAAAYPDRPVTILVPWAAGGPTDAFARVLAARLSIDFGRPFVVDNHTGANGTIGMAAAARAQPDGYTVVVAPNSTYAIAPLLYKLAYDQDRAFMGVGLLASMPFFALVPRASPARTLADYAALTRRPGAHEVYAIPGTGSTSHLAAEMFRQAAGIDITDVGYRGGTPAIQGLLASEAGLLFMSSAGVMPFLRSGDMRALAVTTRERSPLAPEVPTFAEQGFAGYEVVEYVAMLAPAGTPQPIIGRLNAACAAALNAPDMQDRLAVLAVTPGVQSPEAWPAHAAAENAKWRALVRASNIHVE